MTLGQRIQDLRKQHNLSQEALGEKLGVSRQAISRWEMDGAVPEVDKLIAMGRLFGVSLNDLLQVEGPVPEVEAEPVPQPKADPVRRWLMALTAVCVALTVALGALWRTNAKLDQTLSLMAAAAEQRVYTNKTIFQTAECELSDITLGFPLAQGTEDLTVSVALKPVKELKNWEVVGLDVTILGQDPWGAATKPSWHEARSISVKKTFLGPYKGEFTLENYGGEQVTINATLREKDTKQLINAEAVFTVAAPTTRKDNFMVHEILVEEWTEDYPVGRAVVPMSIELLLPDPRYDT